MEKIMDFSNQDVGVRPLSAEEIARSPYYTSNFRANSSNFPRKPKNFFEKSEKKPPSRRNPRKKGASAGRFFEKRGAAAGGHFPAAALCGGRPAGPGQSCFIFELLRRPSVSKSNHSAVSKLNPSWGSSPCCWYFFLRRRRVAGSIRSRRAAARREPVSARAWPMRAASNRAT